MFIVQIVNFVNKSLTFVQSNSLFMLKYILLNYVIGGKLNNKILI